jgi:membrane protein implicated in regulation of membrane protease activity
MAACRRRGMRTEDAFVATTIRFCYDATIAVALATVFALVVSLIAAVIVGGNAPNASVAFVVFMLTGAMLLFRWWRGGHRSASRPADFSHLF